VSGAHEPIRAWVDVKRGGEGGLPVAVCGELYDSEPDEQLGPLLGADDEPEAPDLFAQALHDRPMGGDVCVVDGLFGGGEVVEKARLV